MIIHGMHCRRYLLADSTSLAHSHHRVIKDILEGEEEGSGNGTLGDLRADT